MGPNVELEALQRAGLPTRGNVRLFHATSMEAARSIQESGVFLGDGCKQVWFASSEDIAALHGAAHKVDALMTVSVPVCDLFFETTREGDHGSVELFFTLDSGSGYAAEVVAVAPWPPTHDRPV